MSRCLLTCIALVGLSGCSVVDAPPELEDLVVFGFRNFDGRRPVVEATVTAFPPLLVEHAVQLAEGYRVTDLSQGDLEVVGVNKPVEIGIVGSCATVGLTSRLEDVARAWSHPRMDQVIESTVTFEIREELGERDCFLEQRCDDYGYQGYREMEMGILGLATQNFERRLRWVETESGDTTLTVRELIPDGTEMNNGLIEIHQQFSYSVLFPDGEGTKRLDTFWVEAEGLGIDFPDGLALDFAVREMTKTAEQVDAWVAANP